MTWYDPRTWSPGERLTSTLLNQQVRDNMTFLLSQNELTYVENTTTQFVTATSVSGAPDFFSSTFDAPGGVPLWVEVFLPYVYINCNPADNVQQLAVWLITSTGRVIGQAGTFRTTGSAGTGIILPLYLKHQTSVATTGANTFLIRLVKTSGSGVVQIITGGIAPPNGPAFFRVSRAG